MAVDAHPLTNRPPSYVAMALASIHEVAGERLRWVRYCDAVMERRELFVVEITFRLLAIAYFLLYHLVHNWI